MSDGDLTKYDAIFDMGVEKVFRTYYIRKVNDVNKLIVDLDYLKDSEKK